MYTLTIKIIKFTVTLYYIGLCIIWISNVSMYEHHRLKFVFHGFSGTYFQVNFSRKGKKHSSLLPLVDTVAFNFLLQDLRDLQWESDQCRCHSTVPREQTINFGEIDHQSTINSAAYKSRWEMFAPCRGGDLETERERDWDRSICFCDPEAGKCLRRSHPVVDPVLIPVRFAKEHWMKPCLSYF